jgi:hypothetical protein
MNKGLFLSFDTREQILGAIEFEDEDEFEYDI